MNGLEFIIELLKIISIDVGSGFIIYVGWKYIDYKYFSKLEIEELKEENKYLKKENKKVNGTSKFWSEEDL